MKKYINCICTLAALLIASATFVACSSSDDIPSAPEQPTTKTYTLTIQAGWAEDGTRTIAFNDECTQINTFWTEGDVVKAYYYFEDDEGNFCYGSFDLAVTDVSDYGQSCTLTGKVEGVDFKPEDELYLVLEPKNDTYGGDGTFAYISENQDEAGCTVTVKAVGADNSITIEEDYAKFTPTYCVARFHLFDKSTGEPIKPQTFRINYSTTSTTYNFEGLTNETYAANAYEGDNGDAVLYAALPPTAKNSQTPSISLTAIMDGDAYTCTKPNVRLWDGRFYDIAAKMTYDPTVTPLTMQATTTGTIVVNNQPSGMQYSVNGGMKTTMSAATTTINVNAGDKVQFYGNGTQITCYNGTKIAGGTAEVKVYGNIMSLVDEMGFAWNKMLEYEHAFECLFQLNTNLTDASGLLLPATTLTNSCYKTMFYGCENLTAAPVLPAETLAQACYAEMFQNCYKLNSVTCLATNISATDCTSSWLENAGRDAMETKTFTTPSTTVWPIKSGSGIPEGWTRVDYVAP